MPFCDQCGAENPDWARFCDQCGNALMPVGTHNPQQSATHASLPPNDAEAAPSLASQCPQCGSSVIPGEAFCDNCGASLLSAGGGQTGSNLPASGVAPQQQYPAPQPVVLPQPTPAPTPAAAPAPMPAPPPAARHTLASAQLVLTARNVSLPLPNADEALIGRADAVSGFFPDIDLTPYGGIESGVGRQHVRLLVQGGQVLVEDQDSTNGTFVNGARLSPRTPHPVNNGDEIRLGALVTRLQL